MRRHSLLRRRYLSSNRASGPRALVWRPMSRGGGTLVGLTGFLEKELVCLVVKGVWFSFVLDL